MMIQAYSVISIFGGLPDSIGTYLDEKEARKVFVEECAKLGLDTKDKKEMKNLGNYYCPNEEGEGESVMFMVSSAS